MKAWTIIFQLLRHPFSEVRLLNNYECTDVTYNRYTNDFTMQSIHNGLTKNQSKLNYKHRKDKNIKYILRIYFILLLIIYPIVVSLFLIIEPIYFIIKGRGSSLLRRFDNYVSYIMDLTEEQEE